MEAVGWTEEVLGGQLVGAGAKRISNRKVELHSFGAGKRRQVFVSPHGPDYRVPRGESRPMNRELNKILLNYFHTILNIRLEKALSNINITF